MSNVLVPIAVCMVLPIAIVLIVALTRMNGDNKRTQIIIKAIEANNNVDADKLVESLKKTRKTPREVLSLRLLRGCIFSLVGLGLIIVGLFNLLNGTSFNSDPVSVPFVFGGASIAVGISYLIVYLVTRKQLKNTEGK